MTFFMLSTFCPLSKTSPHTSVLNGQYEAELDSTQNEMCQNQLLRVLLTKLVFPPADVIFHNILDFHSILSGKKILPRNFFFNRFSQTL